MYSSIKIFQTIFLALYLKSRKRPKKYVNMAVQCMFSYPLLKAYIFHTKKTSVGKLRYMHLLLIFRCRWSYIEQAVQTNYILNLSAPLVCDKGPTTSKQNYLLLSLKINTL